MRISTRTFPLSVPLLLCACGLAARLACAGAAVSTDQQRAVEKLIATLDADDFAAREDAAQKLAALGERIRPLLTARMRARPGAQESPELRHGLEKVLTLLQRAADARALEAATHDFDKVIAEAPLHYLPPDPSVDAQLQTPISFEFIDEQIDDAMDYFRQQTHAIIFIDPELTASGVSVINLRVTNMKSSLALAWIVRLLDCDFIVRGRVVVITSKVHALRLRLQGKTLKLPVEPGGAPWTVEQTAAFTKPLEKWSLHDVNTPEPPKVTVTQAGTFELVADREVFEQIEPLLAALGAPDAHAIHFQPLVQDFFTKMNVPLRFSFEKKESVLQAADDLSNLTGFEIGAEDIGSATLDESYASKTATGFDYVAKLCEIAKLSASHSIYIDKNHIQLMPADVGASEMIPCVLDIRPALKAGAAEADLTQRIEQICADARQLTGDENGIPPGKFVRGRRLTMLDVWSARRVAAVIDGAAKTGKVPDAPPLPAFLKRRLPEPAAPDAAQQQNGPAPNNSPADK